MFLIIFKTKTIAMKDKLLFAMFIFLLIMPSIYSP